ncbi:MAG TPA: amylo-alpha-1,6-glucosidase [Vicinamibacterales bacterium]|nr:amylo-alpha-1,6-glucosidase [Vicinamibacterales bacterium]
MDDVIKVEEQYYILATSSRADDRALVLKHGDTFAVFDRYGDVVPYGLGEQGLYHDGTRFLSRFELRLNRRRPLLLSSTVKEDNELLTVDLTNPDLVSGDSVRIARDSLHLLRSKFLWDGACYECWRLTNHGLSPISSSLDVTFAVDFADIFEVRGMRRERRGQPLPGVVEGQSVTLPYLGLDHVRRQACLTFSRVPEELTATSARFDVTLRPQETAQILVTVACGAAAEPEDFDDAFQRSASGVATARTRRCDVFTSNEQFNQWIKRSQADLRMMTTETAQGPYPYAGVPWFSTPFGRDGLITALELLWADPDLARGVLAYLAATQASAVNPERDAEPGKILHERRGGEMAALGEIPFDCYYGSVDATPLFVMLAGAYFQRTANREFIAGLWPHIERALEWIDRYGDRDGDGFVEYATRSPQGLVQQGWKDSSDSVFHDDGRIADPPIALCEVQGYVYDAKRSASALAAMLGHADRADQLAQQAERLRDRFEAAFWCEDLSTYALALDGDKRPCRVRTSNPGHCLFSRIVSTDRARRLAGQLFDANLQSGWGIRTLATHEARYNPMSYHNGSVWPHDNALIAAGLGRYGLTDAASRLLGDLFDASLFVELRRLPELYCGFPRRKGEGPVRYPVACMPQSWSAASVFLMLEGCLGLSIDAPARRIIFNRPTLPGFLQTIRIERLRVGETTLDLLIERHKYDVSVRALTHPDDVEIVLVK